jgi:hypothetical protein
MLSVPIDPVTRRAALEQQLALLAPVADRLGAAARGPAPLIADEWRGEAAETAARFLDELRGVLLRAEAATDEHVRLLRLHLRALG